MIIFEQNKCMKSIAVYIRKSREGKAKRNSSLKEQRLLGQDFCHNNGYKAVYYDDGFISGTIINRPKFQKMIDDIKDNRHHGVFIWNTDRLARDVGSFNELAKAMQETNTLLYDNGVEVDFNDPNKSLFYTIKSAQDAHFAKVTQQKINTILKRNFQEGKAHGRSNYGYTKDINNYIIVDKEESIVVQDIFKLSLSGQTPFKIAEYLNKKGVATKYNKLGGKLTIRNKYTGKTTIKKKEEIKWAESTIRKILTNPIYRGERIIKHKKNKKFETKSYVVPVIIDDDMWYSVNKKFSKNNSGKKVDYKYLMNGLIECNRCSRNFYGRFNKSNGDNYYVCSSKRFKSVNCGNKSINRPKFDDFIWGVLTSKKLIKEIDLNISNGSDVKKIKQLKTDINNLKKKIFNASNMIDKAIGLTLKGIVSEDDLKRQLASIADKKQILEDKIFNKKEELEYLINSQKELKKMKGELSSLKKDIPFGIKQKALQNNIERIYIDSSFNNLYEVKIVFKRYINNLVYVINRSFGIIRKVLPIVNELVENGFYKKYGIPNDKLKVVGNYNNSTFKNKMINRVNIYEPKLREHLPIAVVNNYHDYYEVKPSFEYLMLRKEGQIKHIISQVEELGLLDDKSEKYKKAFYDLSKKYDSNGRI